MPRPDLPVDPDRLRKQFPQLTEDDLAAYVEVTQSLLSASASDRPGRLRALIERGRAVQGGAAARNASDRLAARYVAAIDKMQRPVTGGAPGH